MAPFLQDTAFLRAKYVVAYFRLYSITRLSLADGHLSLCCLYFQCRHSLFLAFTAAATIILHAIGECLVLDELITAGSCRTGSNVVPCEHL